MGYDQLSPNLIHALIATEDERFSEHSGIDARAFIRALVKRGILMQKNAGGGSTITQQLAKQFYSPTADNVMERLFQKAHRMGDCRKSWSVTIQKRKSSPCISTSSIS